MPTGHPYGILFGVESLFFYQQAIPTGFYLSLNHCFLSIGHPYGIYCWRIIVFSINRPSLRDFVVVVVVVVFCRYANRGFYLPANHFFLPVGNLYGILFVGESLFFLPTGHPYGIFLLADYCFFYR